MHRKQKSVTILDVAREAGVSVSTVSRVLNNKADVAFETHQKIQDVIRQLGYTSSLAAKGLRSLRTNVIGLIVPDIATPYCIEVMQGVNRTIAKLDYDLVVYTNGDIRKYGTADQERRYVMLLNGSITDGVIVVAGATTNFPDNAPLVILDPNDDCPNYPAILSTNREGTLEIMAYLTGLGHRRIGFITGRIDLLSANQRLQAYKDGLAAEGIPFHEELIQIGDFTTETGVSCGRALLALDPPPTAIFASNDMTAMGVYQAASEAGVRIPEDLSIVGFDNIKESKYLKPALTTVDQHVADMGAIAAEMIVKLINGETLENKLHRIQTHLLVRDSCLPLADR
jgi:LacI family transcriptional regulator